MENFWRDVRYGLRGLMKNRAFTIVAVLSLGLGIGVNTSIFSLVNAFLLRPLPLAETDRLIACYVTDEKNPGYFPSSLENYKDFRDQNDVFSGLMAYQVVPLSLNLTGQPERIFGEIVTGNFFSVLGANAVYGRTFLPEEDQTRGSHPVVVLNHSFWKSRFNSDPNIAGNTITLNRHKFTVVGVAPEGFAGINVGFSPDVWVPMMMYEQVMPEYKALVPFRQSLMFNVVGRLAEGVTLDQAQAQMKTVAARLEQSYPVENEGKGATLFSIERTRFHPQFYDAVSQMSAMLIIIVGLVLLVACMNVANLLLARASARRREIAMRLAVGASRGRLIRQLLAESLVLALLGGAAGILIAIVTTRLLMNYRPPLPFPFALDLSLDRQVLVFTLVISVLTGIVFGIVPAIKASRLDLVTALKEQGNSAIARNRRFKLRNMLVVAQVTISFAGLVAAGLFLRSIDNAQAIDPGFKADGLSYLSLDLGLSGYDEPEGRAYYRRLIQHMESVPAVGSATLARNIPITVGPLEGVIIEGQEPSSAANGTLVNFNVVGVKYFETLALPIRGRDFTQQDNENAPKVAIINETMARQFWPGEDAIGKRFKFTNDADFRQIIGVAKDSKYISLGETPIPYIYFPLLQNYASSMSLIVRGNVEAAAMVPAIWRETHQLDRDLLLVEGRTFAAHLENSIWPAKMATVLLGVFGLLALALAASGVYGVMSYAVTQRTREIGIRMALGAKQRDVIKMIVKQGMTLVFLGILIGALLAYLIAQGIASFLYGIGATDAVAFVGTTLLVAGVALLATGFPAWRAASANPLAALREE